MIVVLLILLRCSMVIDSIHFNGGTITWQPVNPYSNSSSVKISLIQSYSWTYPTIDCTTNVPISTSGRTSDNANVSCVVDCSTDGGYSIKPVSILTDCVSASLTLGMLSSQRSVNISLTAGAHFYISYRGSAWRALNTPAQSGLYWSILCFIDLRLRPDGFINTPPEANVVSPQYAIVNRTTQIQIPVSDVNLGDDVRCRWSVYTYGYRRRRQLDEDKDLYHKSSTYQYKKAIADKKLVHIRKRWLGLYACTNSACSSVCGFRCDCICSTCAGTTCASGFIGCNITPSCPLTATTTETPGTLPTTSSYPVRQAIDECGSICYPGSMPNGTTLSNCTITFKGLVPNTWYAVAIQVRHD
jgi:hypothetical protein